MKQENITLILLAGIVAVSGCADTDSDTSQELDGDVNVLVGEMYFQQADSGLPENSLEASLEDTITFYNEGDVRHTVTIPSLDVDENISPGETLNVEANETVVNALVDCTLHGTHEAELTITE